MPIARTSVGTSTNQRRRPSSRTGEDRPRDITRGGTDLAPIGPAGFPCEAAPRTPPTTLDSASCPDREHYFYRPYEGTQMAPIDPRFRARRSSGLRNCRRHLNTEHFPPVEICAVHLSVW